MHRERRQSKGGGLPDLRKMPEDESRKKEKSQGAEEAKASLEPAGEVLRAIPRIGTPAEGVGQNDIYEKEQERPCTSVTNTHA